MNKRNKWGIPEWENVLDKRVTIDPEIKQYAEDKLKKLREDFGICYDERRDK